MTAEGLTARETAARLFISARTVEVHRKNLLRKLGLASQTELVRFAVRRGIIEP
jgi:DNA-binding CsgD family transcriptional regulator